MSVRMTRTSMLCVLAVCLAIAIPAIAVAATSSTTRATASAKSGVNALRARTGHAALQSSPALDRSAARYARTMLRRQYFGHTGHISAPRRFHLLGEALAMQPGRHPRPRTAVSMWAHSAPHRALLTNGQFRKIGIGEAVGRFHGRAVTMWVAHVGR